MTRRRSTRQNGLVRAIDRLEIPAHVRELASGALADALMDQYPGVEVIPVGPETVLPAGAVVRPGALPGDGEALEDVREARPRERRRDDDVGDEYPGDAALVLGIECPPSLLAGG